jgi:hypothetical protein
MAKNGLRGIDNAEFVAFFGEQPFSQHFPDFFRRGCTWVHAGALVLCHLTAPLELSGKEVVREGEGEGEVDRLARRLLRTINKSHKKFVVCVCKIVNNVLQSKLH